MATLKDIQRRIRSVEKTQQITSAMRMVAAAKLRRAQDAISAARPYARKMYNTLGEIGRRQRDAEHPLLMSHPERRVLEVLVLTSDRGLCGAFNHSALKVASQAIEERQDDFQKVVVSPIGRKADEYFRRRGYEMPASWTDNAAVDYRQAVEIAEHLAKRYETGDVDEVILVGNEFVSALSQVPRVFPILPLESGQPFDAAETPHGDGDDLPYEIEPDATRLLSVLVPQALEFAIYGALLSNQAGEHAARMAAMESATRNTEELIQNLTLQYNRARQAAITKELVEIVSGAEALD